MNLKTILAIAIGLMVFFVLASALFLPYLATQYEYGFGDCPYPSDTSSCTGLVNGYCSTPSATVVTCTDCNSSAGYETFLSTCWSLIATTNGTDCYQCGGWGFKTTSQGLGVLVFVLAVIGIAVAFFKAKG